MRLANKKLVGAVAAVFVCGAAMPANADGFLDKLTVRGRVINIDPANKSTNIPALSLGSDTIEVESKWAPDIDLELALNDHLGVELLLTIPQTHDVTLKTPTGNADLGTVKHLPPTLTLKYYPLTGKVRPYVGAGLNITWFMDSDLSAGPGSTLDIDSSSFGPAVQAGVDVTLAKNWSLSADIKKAWISTDVSLGATKLTTVHVDPLIYGVGVGYRFGGK